jgi:PKHD-type hydroxylase
MVIYPASSLHHVQPVTRGMRLAAIFSIQSLEQNNNDREILSISTSRSSASATSNPDEPLILSITDMRHNLPGRWSDT